MPIRCAFRFWSEYLTALFSSRSSHEIADFITTSSTVVFVNNDDDDGVGAAMVAGVVVVVVVVVMGTAPLDVPGRC